MNKSGQCCKCYGLKKNLVRKINRWEGKKKHVTNNPTGTQTVKRLGRGRQGKKLSRKELINRSRAVKAVAERAKKLVSDLREEMEDLQEEVTKLKMEPIERICQKHKIIEEQIEVIREIVNSAKRKGPTGNRYTEDWILTCMLLHIRSPTTYNFLRDGKTLPVPDPRTVRRYLAKIDTKCGFDEEFFKLFEKFLAGRSAKQRHGILSIDEMSVTEAIRVCSKTCTYKGVSDFGKEGPSADSIDEKVNHALVIMFTPLHDSYSQPIAVFASKGTVTGENLAKFLLKAIVLAEEAGGIVHGIVSDGAATNKAMWAQFVLSADRGNTVNCFTHPLDDTRFIFMFSDSPHAIKNVRNRLEVKKN